MTNEEIKNSFSALFPAATYDESGEILNIAVPIADIAAAMKALRFNKEFSFDYLFCLTCIDWKTHLMMVYHLRSMSLKHDIVVKCRIDNVDKPEIETVSNIWQTANFHEREVFDLFGVNFLKHPDMRRILLDDQWEGYPLRKNYVDENMIEI